MKILEFVQEVEEGKTEVVSRIEYDDMRHMTNRIFHQIYYSVTFAYLGIRQREHDK